MVRGHARAVGTEAEQRAFEFLKSVGLRPVTRNYRCRRGEVDLVMLDGDCLVFVEVRFRSCRSLTDAALTVDGRKQLKLVNAAEMFMATQPAYSGCRARFDVVGIDRRADGKTTVEWLRDAFGA